MAAVSCWNSSKLWWCTIWKAIILTIRQSAPGACVSWQRSKKFYLANLDRLSTRANLCTSQTALHQTGVNVAAQLRLVLHLWSSCPGLVSLGHWYCPGNNTLGPHAASPCYLDVWQNCMAALLWYLWKTRNAATFNANLLSAADVFLRTSDDLLVRSYLFAAQNRQELSIVCSFFFFLVVIRRLFSSHPLLVSP